MRDRNDIEILQHILSAKAEHLQKPLRYPLRNISSRFPRPSCAP